MLLCSGFVKLYGTAPRAATLYGFAYPGRSVASLRRPFLVSPPAPALPFGGPVAVVVVVCFSKVLD